MLRMIVDISTIVDFSTIAGYVLPMTTKSYFTGLSTYAPATICAALSHVRGWFSLDEFSHFIDPEARKPTAMLRCMEALIRDDCIAPRKDEPGCYLFKDQEPAIDIPPALHLQMASFFQQTDASALKIAGHLEAAGALSEAIPYWSKAIRDAYSAGDAQACISLIERVFAYIAALGPDRHRNAEVLELFLDVFEAVPLFRSAPNIDRIVRAVLDIGSSLPYSPTVDKAMLYCLCSLVWRGRIAEVKPLWIRIYFKSKARHSPEMKQFHRAFLGVLFYLKGKISRASKIFDSLGGDTERLPNDFILLEYFLLVAHCYALSGRISRAVSLIDSIRTHAHMNKRSDVEAWALGTLGIILIESGWYDEAGNILSEIEQIENWDAHFVSRLEYYWIKAYLSYARGRFSEISESLRKLFSTRDRGYKVANFFMSSGIEMAVFFKHLPPERLEEFDLTPFAQLFVARIEKDGIYPAVAGQVKSHEAFQAFRRGEGNAESLANDIAGAETLLLQAGARLAIVKARIMRATILFEQGHQDRAAQILQEHRAVIEELGEGLIGGYLRYHLKPEPPEKLLLNAVISLAHSLGTLKGSEMLINKAMETLNRISGAERGAIFLCDQHNPEKLILRASQGLTAEQVLSDNFQEMYAWLKRAAQERQPLLWSGPGEGTLKPKAAICAPLIIRDQVVGVVYQDNRILKDVFSWHAVELIQALATQVAASIENAHAYEEIERLNALLSEKTAYYEEESHNPKDYQEIIIKSDAMQRVASLVEKVAALDTTVLITGETGVGKELIAALIQRLSPRAEKPYIKVDCTTLPEHLIESELFGHEKGAFTGAVAARMGRFELADGGTLFLDELGELPLSLQAKLLRILQDGEFERLGSTRTRQVDVRILAATNRDLVAAVAKLSFRADLFYRLNVFPIHIPPLRERTEDIPSLSMFFLGRISKVLGKRFAGITRRDIARLKAYDWPGNVRELKHTIERSAILSPEGRFILSLPSGKAAVSTHRQTLAQVERTYITEVLEHTGWKVSGPGGAAAILGMNRTTLLSRMKKLAIARPGSHPAHAR